MKLGLYPLNAFFVSALLVGCGGLNRNIELQPLAPNLTDTAATVMKERGGSWRLDLGGAEFRIWPVRLSTKTTWVFGPFIAFPTLGLADEVYEEGPLVIGFYMEVDDEVTVNFDPRECVVALDDGLALTPTAAKNTWSAEPEAVTPLTYSSGENRLWLQYDVSLENLKMFTLRLGMIDVGGKAVNLPPISFVRGKSFYGS